MKIGVAYTDLGCINITLFSFKRNLKLVKNFGVCKLSLTILSSLAFNSLAGCSLSVVTVGNVERFVNYRDKHWRSSNKRTMCLISCLEKAQILKNVHN